MAQLSSAVTDTQEITLQIRLSPSFLWNLGQLQLLYLRRIFSICQFSIQASHLLLPYHSEGGGVECWPLHLAVLE